MNGLLTEIPVSNWKILFSRGLFFFSFSFALFFFFPFFKSNKIQVIHRHLLARRFALI